MNRRFTRCTAGIVLVSFMAACTTTNHLATMNALTMNVPVSASSYWLEKSGGTVGPNQYRIVEHFKFTKTLEGMTDSESKGTINIEDDLGSIVQRTQADAVVNLMSYAEKHDPGTTYETGVSRIVGSMCSMFGVMFLIMANATKSKYNDNSTLFTFGGIFSGVGVGGLVLSFVLPPSKKPAWVVTFEGDVVRVNR